MNSQKPSLYSATEVKPQMIAITDFTDFMLIERTLGRGMLNGMLGMTYPEDIQISYVA